MTRGTIVFVKSIEARQLVEMHEDKNGRERPRVNRFGFKFQGDDYMSQVGVFVFLGKMPEGWQLLENGKPVDSFVEREMNALGWYRREQP